MDYGLQQIEYLFSGRKEYTCISKCSGSSHRLNVCFVHGFNQHPSKAEQGLFTVFNQSSNATAIPAKSISSTITTTITSSTTTTVTANNKSPNDSGQLLTD